MRSRVKARGFSRASSVPMDETAEIIIAMPLFQMVIFVFRKS